MRIAGPASIAMRTSSERSRLDDLENSCDTHEKQEVH